MGGVPNDGGHVYMGTASSPMRAYAKRPALSDDDVKRPVRSGQDEVAIVMQRRHNVAGGCIGGVM